MSADPINVIATDAEQKATFWFNMIKFIGWPGVILIVIAYSGLVTAQAIWPYAVKIADTHITVVTGLLEQQKKQDAQAVESNIMMGKINDNQTRISDNQIKIIDEINAGQTLQGKLLIEIHKAVVKSVDKDKE